MRFAAATLAFAFAAFAPAAGGDDGANGGFTPDEVAKILAHGPWPPARGPVFME